MRLSEAEKRLPAIWGRAGVLAPLVLGALAGPGRAASSGKRLAAAGLDSVRRAVAEGIDSTTATLEPPILPAPATR